MEVLVCVAYLPVTDFEPDRVKSPKYVPPLNVSKLGFVVPPLKTP